MKCILNNVTVFNKPKKIMRTLRILVLLALCFGFLFSTTSCVVFVKKDNGKHKGWTKNDNNPNNSNSENSKGKHKK